MALLNLNKHYETQLTTDVVAQDMELILLFSDLSYWCFIHLNALPGGENINFSLEEK